MSDALANALDSLFKGKATWRAQRDAMSRDTIIGFQCSKHTPVIRITDSFMEDARDTARWVAEQCIELYNRHHVVMPTLDPQPVLTCHECRAPVDVPSDRKLNDFEFCERQSVLWAERAMKARR